eukprot:1161434-Pelagomonas_calceolata.AAC.3
MGCAARKKQIRGQSQHGHPGPIRLQRAFSQTVRLIGPRLIRASQQQIHEQYNKGKLLVVLQEEIKYSMDANSLARVVQEKNYKRTVLSISPQSTYLLTPTHRKDVNLTLN